MKNFITIVKGNPIVVAAIAVVVMALAFLFLGVHLPGNAFIADVENRKSDFSSITSLKRTELKIPSKNPDDPPRSLQIPINQATIDSLEGIYKVMGEQYKTVFDDAIKHNRASHKPMLDNLFPDPSDVGQLFTAKQEYLKQLGSLLLPPSPVDKDAVRLNAGVPPESAVIDEELGKVEARFLAGFFPRKALADLTPEDQTKLLELQRARTLDLIREAARRVSIYAELDVKGEEFPFSVAAWAIGAGRPEMHEIWEGQMNLWIQQDICRAIAAANRPIKEKDSLHTTDNVLTAPVKHLKWIKVKDDYVGLRGNSTLTPLTVAANASRDNRGGGGPGGFGPPGGRPNIGAAMDMFRDKSAIKLVADDLKTQSADKRLPEDFGVSPTGRVCNVLYDVRLAELSIVVDIRQLPRVLERLDKTNFMSILNVRVDNVDEYDALKEGFMYGECDCVQVTLLLETIWLRDWTKEVMPKAIKEMLGIEAPAAAVPAAGTPPGK